jgi:hypothetical protein
MSLGIVGLMNWLMLIKQKGLMNMTPQEALEILKYPDDWYGVDDNNVMLSDCEYAEALQVIEKALQEREWLAKELLTVLSKQAIHDIEELIRIPKERIDE